MPNKECGCLFIAKHYGAYETVIERTYCRLHAAAPLLLKALKELLPIADQLTDKAQYDPGSEKRWKSQKFLDALDHAHLAVREASVVVPDAPVSLDAAVSKPL